MRTTWFDTLGASQGAKLPIIMNNGAYCGPRGLFFRPKEKQNSIDDTTLRGGDTVSSNRIRHKA